MSFRRRALLLGAGVVAGVCTAAQAIAGEAVNSSSENPRGHLIYTIRCSNCHDDGINGAPKLGEVAAWAMRTPEWTVVLVSHAINGYITMAPKGGYRNLSDQDVAAAVEYMASKVKPASMSPSTDLSKGMQIYTYGCSNCHDSGLNGAPKLGDSVAWHTRSVEWKSILKQHATSGFITMAPKGGFHHLTDEEVAEAVDYMVTKVKPLR